MLKVIVKAKALSYKKFLHVLHNFARIKVVVTLDMITSHLYYGQRVKSYIRI